METTGDTATTTTTDAREISEAEAEELMQQQREYFERVGRLEEQLRRVRVTNGTRITDIGSKLFENSGPAGANRQRELVAAAAAAFEKFEAGDGALHLTGATAIVEEAIVALCNDLLLSENTETMFGVSMPDWDKVDTIYRSHNGEVHIWSDSILEEVVGLLVYRVWQLLVRTPAGRRTMYTVSGSEEAEVDIDSFEAMTALLASKLSAGKMVDFFTECVDKLELPPGNDGQTLTSLEKSVMKKALNNRMLDWTVPRS